MTTLNEAMTDSDLVAVVTPGSEQDNGFRFRIDDEILTFLGYDRDSTADIIAWRAGDRTRWRVARGQDGTAAASHAGGSTLYAVAEAFATGSDLTPPSPFAAGGTPTLAEVLAEGNDPDGGLIQGADSGTNVGAIVEVQGASGSSGGSVNLSSGPFDGGTKTGAGVFVNGGYAESDGFVVVNTFNSNGNKGDALLNDDSQGSGGLRWQALITVQSPTPTVTYITPLVLADAGLYAWTGAAYTKIGDTPS